MLTMRTASEADAVFIASLIRQSFLKQARKLGISEIEYPNNVAYETEAGVRRRILSGIHVALACQRATIVGTVSYVFRFGITATGEIMRLAVLPQHRGRGYGQELMTHAEKQLMAAGAALARLSIVAQFERLRTYYEGLGYTAREMKSMPGLPFELLFMEKKLIGDGREMAPRNL